MQTVWLIFFGMQKNLKLVFLNGCSTKAQIEVLQNQGIENVIATVKDIDDNVGCNDCR